MADSACARSSPGARCASRGGSRPRPSGRLRGVARDVEDRLDQLLLVAGELGQARVVVAAHREARREIPRAAACARARCTSWMLSGSTRGRRFGVSRRFMSDCSRSASFTITCVNSRSSGSPSSRSSSCAAPRMPPSGFLISCARLRISSRLACLLLEDLRLARDLQLLLQLAQLEHQARRRRRLRRGVDHAVQVHADSPRPRAARSLSLKPASSSQRLRAGARRIRRCRAALVERRADEVRCAPARRASRRRDSRRSRGASSSSISTAVDSSSRPWIRHHEARDWRKSNKRASAGRLARRRERGCRKRETARG